MTTTSRALSPFALAALMAAFALPGTACSQKPKKLAPDKEVAEKVGILTKIAKDKKFSRDAEGIQVIDILMQKHEKGLAEKDRKMVVKALDGVLNKNKVRPPDRTQLYNAAAEALGRHEADGAKVLRKAFDNKSRFKAKPQWVPMRERLLRNVGRTKALANVKFLIDEARRNPEPALQAAAGDALGNYEEADLKVRKEIVSNLLVTYGALSERASQQGTSIDAQNAKDRLAAISGKWNGALKKLSKQNFDTFREWQTWYNKNKTKKW